MFPYYLNKHTIVRIFKSEDPMMANNYITSMIGHFLAKLYGSIHNSELSVWTEKDGCKSTSKQVSKRVHNFESHTKFVGFMKVGRSHKCWGYCCFMNFWKAINIVLQSWLKQRLEALGIPLDMEWRIMHYMNPFCGKEHTSIGLSEFVASTIVVKLLHA